MIFHSYVSLPESTPFFAWQKKWPVDTCRTNPVSSPTSPIWLLVKYHMTTYIPTFETTHCDTLIKIQSCSKTAVWKSNWNSETKTFTSIYHSWLYQSHHRHQLPTAHLGRSVPGRLQLLLQVGDACNSSRLPRCTVQLVSATWCLGNPPNRMEFWRL